MVVFDREEVFRVSLLVELSVPVGEEGIVRRGSIRIYNFWKSLVSDESHHETHDVKRAVM
jgi:hypothetical protein